MGGVHPRHNRAGLRMKDHMTTSLTTTGNAPDMLAMCASVAKSGLGGIKTPEAAFALTAMALAEDTDAGDSPVSFLRALGRAQRDYHVINGRPTLKADAMLARFQVAGGKVRWLEYSDKRVCGEFSHAAGGNIELDWTIDRAKTAGLLKPGSPWIAHPRAMLRARVISEAIRTVFPGVISGLYSPEEAVEIDQPVMVQRQAAPADITDWKGKARELYIEVQSIDKAEAVRLHAETAGDAKAFCEAAEAWKAKRAAPIMGADDVVVVDEQAQEVSP